jgi:TPR repeat protein
MHLAAQGGHREAQFQCAMSCFRGDVAPQDFEGGRQWLAKAAEAGWGRAEFCLYQLYDNGVPPGPGCPPYPKNTTEAIKWLRQAAGHENLQAQSILAVMLIRGIGVETNAPEALKLLRHAAERGYAQAQNDLGYALETGDAGKVDLVEAAMWCQLAVSTLTDPNVLRRAQVNLNHAVSRLDEEQQREVSRRVQNFKALPVAQMDPLPEGWRKNPNYEQEDGSFGH